jgi:hypothetical protein
MFPYYPASFRSMKLYIALHFNHQSKRDDGTAPSLLTDPIRSSVHLISSLLRCFPVCLVGVSCVWFVWVWRWRSWLVFMEGRDIREIADHSSAS